MNQPQEEIVAILEKALADAKAGKTSSVMLVTVAHDGSASFSTQSNKSVPIELFGAMEWAKSHVLHKLNAAQLAHKEAVDTQTPIN